MRKLKQYRPREHRPGEEALWFVLMSGDRPGLMSASNTVGDLTGKQAGYVLTEYRDVAARLVRRRSFGFTGFLALSAEQAQAMVSRSREEEGRRWFWVIDYDCEGRIPLPTK